MLLSRHRCLICCLFRAVSKKYWFIFEYLAHMIKQACIDLLREGYGKREIDEESLHVCRKRKATGKLLHLIQVMNEKLQFVWMQFAELYAYVRKQVDDSEKLNKKLAEMLALLTCEEQSNSRKSIKFDVTPKSKDILSGGGDIVFLSIQL
ncbi:uncharacterized protein LOC107850915 isoform X6 [Capsicum annuum]|uniref:uncharacterized protein LOC107850915 isoform X6 n=1 Tax=Capsicum annuum TaxID=4072 RepID=UPI0007BF77A5|nr:uncharacterized protein LOC107850915 isoform X6 [Capsicum annuum]